MLFSFLSQQGPAQTTGYMIAGYVVIFGVMLIYLISLIVRTRNAQQEYQIFQELENKPQ
jgi:hypothetical protein